MKKKICVITTIETTLESFVIPVMRLFMQRGFDVTLMCMEVGHVCGAGMRGVSSVKCKDDRGSA